MARVLVVAPHPDDETLGPGGTLLAHREAGHELHWLLMTEMREAHGYDRSRIDARADEIAAVREHYGFAEVHALGWPAAGLDGVPRSELVPGVAAVVSEVRPTVVYLPHPGDAHTDHRDTFEASLAALKVFRAPDVSRILCYETLSETDSNPLPQQRFAPTTYVDISATLDEKVRILHEYASELGPHPFPRSEVAVRALATLRGAQAGVVAAEAFQLVRERVLVVS